MPFITCPQCHNQVSIDIEACPHCGTLIRSKTTSPYYEYKTKRVTCWGKASSNKIVKKLRKDKEAGWKIISIVEDHLHSGLLRHVVKVNFEREIK